MPKNKDLRPCNAKALLEDAGYSGKDAHVSNVASQRRAQKIKSGHCLSRGTRVMYGACRKITKAGASRA